MPAGKYIYRVLRDDEDPKEGLSARDPSAKDAKVSSHVNGLKKSPYISFTATEKAARAFYWLAVKRWKKKFRITCENNCTDSSLNKLSKLLSDLLEKEYRVVKVDKEKLLKENKKVEVFDLSDKSVRGKYFVGLLRLYNYAKAYDEVLIKGFVPADCIKVVPLQALTDDESSSEGYEESDYNPN